MILIKKINIMNHKQFCLTSKIIVFLFVLLPLESSFGNNPVPEKDNFRFLEMDIAQIQQGYKDGTFTVQDVVQAYLNRIQEIDQNGPSLHSIILVNPDAVYIAKALDKIGRAHV